MAGWLFLLAALAGTAIVVNAARPSRGPISLLPSWALAFLTLDLALFHIVLALAFAGGFALLGALCAPRLWRMQSRPNSNSTRSSAFRGGCC